MNAKDINPLALPSVPLIKERLRQLPTTPAIYFAIDASNQIQYIGRSINPQQRWLNHHRYTQLSDLGAIRIAWLKVSSPELLPEIEEALINWFCPPLNGAACPTVSGKSRTSSVQTVLPDENLEKLKVIAKEQDRSASYLIALAVQEWLERQVGEEAS